MGRKGRVCWFGGLRMCRVRGAAMTVMVLWMMTLDKGEMG